MNKETTYTISLIVTHKCNLNCIYCYEQHKSADALDVEDAKRYLVNAYNQIDFTKYDAVEIAFIGGEPLIEFERIVKISEWIWQQPWTHPCMLFATTNGTLLTERQKLWFTTHKDRFVLGLSVDGNANMQNMNRSQSSAMIDYDFFRTQWPKQPVKMTISNLSLPYLAQGVIHLQETGFSVQANLAFGVQWKPTDLVVYREQLNILMDYYLNNPNVQRCSLLNLDLLSVLLFSKEYRKYCGCGEGTTVIDTDGTRYPCIMFAPLTLPKERFEQIRNMDFGDESLFQSKECSLCLLRNLCPRCYGMSYLSYGDVKKQDSFMCQAFKIQFLSNCSFLQKMIEKGLVKMNKKELKELLTIINTII